VISFPVVFVAFFLLQSLAQLLPFWDINRDLQSLFWHTIEVAIPAVIGVSFVSSFAFRNLYDPDYSQASAVDRYAYFDMEPPYDRAFDSCLASLDGIGKATILLEDRVNGRIEAAIRPANWWDSWRSWGQRVSFKLGSDQEGRTRILVTSRTPVAGSVTGKDRNKRNIEGIIAYLREEAEKQVLVSR
jgi:hypothetical protein